uniref:Integrase, catalytic region, zinc finger, CCHC-type, peptidase aspartic, catalytic n=1 Tax=Tanacetum cinerariifolium TaxID=118510 RepID=A0A6L2NPG5_TANCI|nr:hypothetical protein [Tanacetum cinerariifolium]
MVNFLKDIQCASSEHYEVHEMHDVVQPNCVVVSDTEYTGDSNMIPYDQYVKDNVKPIVQNNASSVSNDASMIIINEMPELTSRCDSVKEHTKVVDASLTIELAIYKEQVKLYERRAKFELTVREQKIDEQLRIIITDRNIKEENLKKELHFVKMQLQSTINHNKSMVEEVTSLKKDFKQKENKYLKEFLDMKALKEKVEDKLFKQGQSLQTIHMLCKPKPYYDEQRKHVPAIVHNSEDTIKIAEITKKKMNEKMKTPLWTHNKINIRPPDYSKQNFLATFTPQTRLTPKQIFWSKDVLKMKTKALAEHAKAAKPVRALTVFSKMHDAHTVVQARYLELETELSKLKDKIQKDDHDVMVKPFSNLEDGPYFDLTFEIKKLKASIQGKDNAIRKLRTQIYQLQETHSEADCTLNFKALDIQITQLTEKVSVLQEQNELVENAKVKQHYKDYSVTPKVLAPGIYAIDVEPIPPRFRNNREVYLKYLKHLKESVATIHEIVEEARVKRTLDSSLAFACLYTKRSQELVEYAIGTCPKDFHK